MVVLSFMRAIFNGSFRAQHMLHEKTFTVLVCLWTQKQQQCQKKIIDMQIVHFSSSTVSFIETPIAWLLLEPALSDLGSWH